jgi:hypothetical protein
MGRTLVALGVLCAVVAVEGCQIECAPCPGGPGYCGGNPVNCGPCGTICPGFCFGDAGPAKIQAPVPCPGFCANDAGTAATPCDGG